MQSGTAGEGTFQAIEIYQHDSAPLNNDSRKVQ